MSWQCDEAPDLEASTRHSIFAETFSRSHDGVHQFICPSEIQVMEPDGSNDDAINDHDGC